MTHRHTLDFRTLQHYSVVMTIAEIAVSAEATIVVGDREQHEVAYGFASDLMSDVLTVMQDNVLLITGLANLQTIRTAIMADISAILIVRNKRATQDMRHAAHEGGIVLLETEFSMFRASGILYDAGLLAVF